MQNCVFRAPAFPELEPQDYEGDLEIILVEQAALHEWIACGDGVYVSSSEGWHQPKARSG